MKLFNTMSMQKEEFVPIEPGKVRMYACGPTVYNYIHVGNARPIIMFDVLRRYLEYRGYEVTFVQNFTDVDDKIIKRANEEGITSEEVAKKYIAEYFTDAHALGVREATVHPKATENIQQIIDLITTLIDKGYAYEVNGDVYYRTLKFKDYGKLSHQPIEDLQSGARIDVNDIKETRSTLHSGKPPSPASRSGNLRGAKAVPAGISSARPCPTATSARRSTSTAAAATSPSRTMRMRLPSLRPPMAASSSTTGCITALSTSTTRR